MHLFTLGDNAPRDAELIRTEILEANAKRTDRRKLIYAETLKKIAQSKSAQEKGEGPIQDLEQALTLQKMLLRQEPRPLRALTKPFL